jgi:hypothetical protein
VRSRVPKSSVEETHSLQRQRPQVRKPVQEERDFLVLGGAAPAGAMGCRRNDRFCDDGSRDLGLGWRAEAWMISSSVSGEPHSELIIVLLGLPILSGVSSMSLTEE